MRGAALRGERGAVSAPGSAPAAGRFLGPCAGVAAVSGAPPDGGNTRQRAPWCAPMVIVPGRVEEGVGRLLCAFPRAARSAGAIVCLLRGERGLCAAGSARAAPRPGLGSELQSCSWGLQRISLFCCLTVGAQARFLNLKGSPVKSACRLN